MKFSDILQFRIVLVKIREIDTNIIRERQKHMLTRFLTRREAALISLDRRCSYSISSIKSSASYTACLASLSHLCTAGFVICFSSASSRSPLRVFSVSFNFPRRPSLSLWLLKKPRISGVVNFSPRTSMTAKRIDRPMYSTAMMGSLQRIGRKQKQRIVEKKIVKRIRRLTNGKGRKNQSKYAGSQLTSQLCHSKLLTPDYHFSPFISKLSLYNSSDTLTSSGQAFRQRCQSEKTVSKLE